MMTRGWAFAPMAGAAALMAFSLAACDGAPSATAARSHSPSDRYGSDRRLADATADGDGGSIERSDRSGGYGRRADADTPMYHGKPIWAANKNHSAQENADYHFKRDGGSFGASSVDDFVAKAHGFIDAPPKGALIAVRSNGDKLIYDPKDNTFAVASRDGAPRTLFKPRDGQAYWDKQKAALDAGQDYPARKTARRGGDGGDNG